MTATKTPRACWVLVDEDGAPVSGAFASKKDAELERIESSVGEHFRVVKYVPAPKRGAK